MRVLRAFSHRMSRFFLAKCAWVDGNGESNIMSLPEQRHERGNNLVDRYKPVAIPALRAATAIKVSAKVLRRDDRPGSFSSLPEGFHWPQDVNED